MQEAARKRLEAVHSVRLLGAAGIAPGERYAEAAARAGVSVSTLRGWVRQCNGLDPGDWVVALAPGHPGSRDKVAIAREAWEAIRAEYLTTTKPALAPIYRRAARVAREKGYTLPSYITVKRLIMAIPLPVRVMLREGAEAFERMFPTQRRRYDELDLHELWCADGRKVDVWVRWEDGTISRPIIVAWIDLRSRVCLGYVLSRVESADAIRLSFKRAAEAANALPRRVLLDNGRGFASRLISGGSPNRYRFKVKNEDIPGILTMLVGEISWATPRLGRAKPIESFWRTLTHLDKQFPGAYCGNAPEARPEDCDPRKSVPIAQYRAALEESIRDYNEKPHRGHGMDGRSPRATYEELLPKTVVRRPTREQLRLCMLAAERVRLNRDDGSVTILGNRYWMERCAALDRDKHYTARFDPEDATVPIALYSGLEFICELPLIERTGFRDQQAAKDHLRSKRAFKKAVDVQVAALGDMRKARSWLAPAAPEPQHAPESGAGTLPVPKVVEPLRPPVNLQIMKPGKPRGESPEKVRQAAASELQRQFRSKAR